MDYRFLIARRYLAGRKRVTLISIISGISIGGVALGVAALVVVLSVLNGFYDVVRELLVSYDPHVRIEAVQGRGLTAPDSLRRLALGQDDVESATSFVEGKALLTDTEGAAALNQVVTVRGVDSAGLDSTVTQAVTSGRFDVARRGGLPGLVMGAALASRSGLFPGPTGNDGSRVAMLSAPALERALVQYPFGLPARQTFALRGVFELEPVYDESHVFVSLDEAQRLFRMSGRVSGIDLRLNDIDRAERVRDRLARQLDAERFRVLTWYDLQASLYGVMQLEKWAASAILLLIVVVAAFNIVGALTMTVIEKRRDLGVLRAMGASQQDVRRIFLLEGAMVGFVGTGIGLVVGLGICFMQAQFALVPLAEAGSFVIDAYPVTVRAFDVVLTAVLAVGLCVAAAVYPALRGSAVEPARAVQSQG